jgi:hypothetical protein
MTTRDVGAGVQAMRALEAELRGAEQQFGSDDFSEFTVDELDRRAIAGEWPWAPPPAATPR